MQQLEEIRLKTVEMQARAASPHASAWVSANAGTGKTHVLVQRVLRLLLAGTQPERILCLTFTKAAASEMANRLFRDLSKWTVLSDEDLVPLISEVLKRDASAEDIVRARQLFALALETPGGLKVQTIHAFCERVLQRFPLEAGIAPHFTVLDEEQERTIRRQCIDQILSKAARDEASSLGKALQAVIAYTGDQYFDDVLSETLNDKEGLEAAQALAGADGSETDVLGLEKVLAGRLGVPEGASEDALLAAMAEVVTDAQIAGLVPVLEAGKKTDVERAEALRIVRGTGSLQARVHALMPVFLTSAGSARADSRFITKGVGEERPDVADLMMKARDAFAQHMEQLSALRAAKASASLAHIAVAVMRAFETMKASRAVLDFDDLIDKTAKLLRKSDASAWVLYKLDGGIDHILVDEAQDTSPAAWSVIEALADEFFAGAGARDVARTVFAVGDEKQSIYGFQGAVPEKFAQMGGAFRGKAELVEALWHRVPLTLSFRSTSPVLEAVDLVFGGENALSGITAGGDEIKHFSYRAGHAGVVEIWETEKHLSRDQADPWEPLAEEAADDPKSRLAERIADQVGHWLATGEELASHGRPIRPGDILILVRKREPFAPAIIAALKARNIPVAGADRIKLTEQIAVMDLMALGDFLLLPEDDLSLACVLKSPLFDLDDDDLFEIGYGRKNSLWEALADKAETNSAYNEVYETLRFFLARSDLKPPYEFFESLLDWEGRRARFVERLGPEAGDAIDEFLHMALTYDDMSPPSLQGFIGWMRSSSAEVKRDMEQGRDEVRVMTVHGAKGLEANIVFMPDTCSARGAQSAQTVLRLGQDGAGVNGTEASGALLWAIPAAKGLDSVKSAREKKKRDAEEEYHRLLYVAMTRARDRLYVCGFENKTGRDSGCWYDLIRDNLEGRMTPADDGRGGEVLRFESPQVLEPDRKGGLEQEISRLSKLPEWAQTKAPSEPVRTIPVAPSTLVPLDEDDEAEIEEVLEPQQPIMPPRQMAESTRFLRGQLTHALLEHLPGMEPSMWREAAERLVEARGGALHERTQKGIVDETLAILTDEKFFALFGPHSMAEVPLTARLEPSGKSGAPIVISGQIDRLAVDGDDVLIVDYKTNRPPPEIAENVADAYLTQLAAYRVAISKIYPEKRVKCAILWTDGPRMMEIPAELLDIHEAELAAYGVRRS